MLATGIRIDPTIFRAYDIRGIVGQTLTPDTVFVIGQALGSIVREGGGQQMTIARDGRLSGPALSRALADGIVAAGCDVIDLGMVPTPLLYYATTLFNEHSGVMLTGSHNPTNYNGLKMVIDGRTFAAEAIQQLYHRIVNERFTSGAGRRTTYAITDHYLTAVLKNIQLARPLTIVIDAGNGVTGVIAPTLFRALGCVVHELYCDVDGNFPNHHPDPSHLDNLADLRAAVLTHQADIGLAFDGDGDRLGVVTSSGNIILPDRLLILFARALLATQPQATIIYDVKCTNHLETAIREQGGTPLMWKTGHSMIKDKMNEIGAPLAGEMSGHFFFKDRWHGFDDGLYAAARLLEILAQQSISSDEMFQRIPNSVNTPELKVLVADTEKFSLMQTLIAHANFPDAKEIMTIDGLRVNFAQGWGLVRPSNTSPYLILRFEALNDTVLTNIQQLFKHWLLSVKPDLVLPF